MGIRTKAAMGLLAGLVNLYAQPARGQIAVTVDERGKRVFVNAETRDPGVPARSPNSKALGIRRNPSATPPKEELQSMARETAKRHRVDPELVHAVIEAESNWNPAAISSKGAQGLMQLVPGTAEGLGVDNVFDPAKNIEGGVTYLGMLLEKYGGDLDKALAAYNAGAGAVDRAGGVPHNPETRAYVQKVIAAYFRPGSGRGAPRSIYRIVDQRGRIVFTNE